MVNGRGRGDQYVTIRVTVPANLTDEQRAALQTFAETMGEGENRSGTPVKDFFKKNKKK
jgi:molecular chaperone DnaJ